MSTDISFAKLSIEARTEVIKEAMESTLWSLEKSEKEIEFLRARLQEQKEALGHGRWLAWIRETFGDDNATIRKLQRFLKKPNTTLLTYLEISGGQLTPRSERKTGQVKVTTPPDDPDDVGTVDDYPPGDFDVDPTPAPPTIRKTAAGTQKVKEADKPKTRPIVPEILEEDSVEAADRTGRVITAFVIQCEIRQFLEMKRQHTGGDSEKWKKAAAKELRKEADKLDPPTKFVRPDLEEVSAYFAEQQASDPDSFFDFYESKGWLVGKVSMKDWRASARKWIRENKHNGKVNGNNGHLSREQQREQNNANSIGYLVKLKREQEQQRRIASGD